MRLGQGDVQKMSVKVRLGCAMKRELDVPKGLRCMQSGLKLVKIKILAIVEICPTSHLVTE